MSRLIIFGDIHGCYEEWEDLLHKLKVTKKDRLVSVGDLICKGPSTKKVLDMAIKMPNLQCIRGNHEHHLLNAWHKKALHEVQKDYQQRAIKEMGKKIDKYMEFMESWPFYLTFPECTVVHAGVRPNIPINEQNHHDLVFLRTLEDGTPWHEAYKKSKLIVYGHWARQGLMVKKNSIGLDSGCVYGKELSALVLPKHQIISVKARKVHLLPSG